MQPGITIQHAREHGRDPGLVRSDVLGLIGLVPRARWPEGAVPGDFVDLHLASWADYEEHPERDRLDPVTVRALRSFFENGGVECHVFGVCVASEQDLLREDPTSTPFDALLDHLRGEEDVALLAMPLLAYLPVRFGQGRAQVLAEPIYRLFLEHCREMNNRFLLLDTPRDLHDHALEAWLESFRESLGEGSGVQRLQGSAPSAATYGAVYYPWLHHGDTVFPPSGVVAGLYARVEREHAPFGIRWPPANRELHGVTHPAVSLRWREAERLAECGVNPLLSQPGRGVVVWGARTLSRDPRWMHVNARRIMSFVAEQLRRDSEWIVFENHRPELYEIVQRRVRSRLDALWEAGLLAGDSAGSQYLVRCDAELNPPQLVEPGQVNVQVTLRPISTTEHIVVDLRLGA